MHIGRHMPASPRPAEALRLTERIGGDAVQIFVTNPRSWRASSPRPREEAEFRSLRAALGHWPVVVHAAYLINLASPNDDFFEKSVVALRTTLQRAANFEANAVVFHIGSHTGSGEEAGVSRLVAGIERALDGSPATVRLLLENDVGGGGKLGARLETIGAVLAALPQHAHQLGVCLDTAHLWGAGFDIGEPESAGLVLAAADAAFGLSRVDVIHLNDSRADFASHRDHHARLGEGTIPQGGLAAFLRFPALAGATVILETPLPTVDQGTDLSGDGESWAPNADRVDWDSERRQIFQVCDLIGIA